MILKKEVVGLGTFDLILIAWKNLCDESSLVFLVCLCFTVTVLEYQAVTFNKNLAVLAGPGFDHSLPLYNDSSCHTFTKVTKKALSLIEVKPTWISLFRSWDWSNNQLFNYITSRAAPLACCFLKGD